MTSDRLKLFEEHLFSMLKSLNVPEVDLKATKGKVYLMEKKTKLGLVYIQHLRRADGFYAGVEVYSCEAMNFCTGQKPPYETRLANASFLSSTSLSEDYKKFGDEIGGIVRVPDLAGIPSAVEKIETRLSDLYLSRAINGITAPLQLIKDVIEAPDDYAFPFLTALYVASKHGLCFNSDEFQEVVAQKNIYGKKQFDIELARNTLD
jgi:hypothetical protein